MTPDPDSVARLLTKLRWFASEELDSEERVLLGVMLAPGLQAMTQAEEVEGFSFARAGDAAIAEALQAALRRSRLRIVDFPTRDGT